jgi:hypothetical protein
MVRNLLRILLAEEQHVERPSADGSRRAGARRRGRARLGQQGKASRRQRRGAAEREHGTS